MILQNGEAREAALESKLVEVVGSNHPTRSTFIILVKYGISLSLFLGMCRTNSAVI